MKPAYRKPGALGVVMGILAGMVVGMGVVVRDAGGHAIDGVWNQGDFRADGVAVETKGYLHRQYISNSHNSIVLTRRSRNQRDVVF